MVLDNYISLECTIYMEIYQALINAQSTWKYTKHSLNSKKDKQ